MNINRVVSVIGVIFGLVSCQGPGDGEFKLNAESPIAGSGLAGDPLRLADAGLLVGVGTIGALPKYIGPKSLGDSAIVERDGRVNIGVTNPDWTNSFLQELSVGGGISAGVGVGSTGFTGGSASNLMIHGRSAASTTTAAIQFGDNDSLNSRQFAIANGHDGLMPRPGSLLFLTSTAVNRDPLVSGDVLMALHASGALGLGTTQPQARLQVAPPAPPGMPCYYWGECAGRGAFYVGDGRVGVSVGVANGGPGDGDVRIWASGGSEKILLGGATKGNDTLVIANSNVGVGTASPSGKLSVAAGVGSATAIRFADMDAPMQWAGLTAGSTWIALRNRDDKHVMTVRQDNGYVGFGTIDPKYLLHVSGGRAYFDSGADCGPGCVASSSRSLKSNIRELSGRDAVATIAMLTPSRFQYKSAPGEEKLGFIAEDVPDLVAMNDRKSLDPMEFAALLTKVVQEQQKEIAAQKRQNAELLRRLELVEAALGRRGK